jgi:hypothetical protein
MPAITTNLKVLYLPLCLLFFILKFLGIIIGNWSPYNNIIDLIWFTLQCAIIYNILPSYSVTLGQYNIIDNSTI